MGMSNSRWINSLLIMQTVCDAIHKEIYQQISYKLINTNLQVSHFLCKRFEDES